MSYISNDFIYFDPNFKGENGDFTDNSVFTANERRDFLCHYADYLKKSYNLPEKSQYVVSKEKVKQTRKLFENSNNVFKTMTAYRADMPKKFKNWNLFTNKAQVCGESVCLKNADLPPNPSAEYILNSNKKLNEIVLKFSIDSDYQAQHHGNVRDTDTAKTVELRCGITDILKIGLYSNGECYARVFTNDPYHSKFIKIGNFNFDIENELKIVLHNDTFDTCLNGQETLHTPLNSIKTPDTLFFSGGMFHFGDFEIKPVKIVYNGEEITEFFTLNDNGSANREYIGEVSVPYAIGTSENQNKMLILEKEFILPNSPFVELDFETLDPGGEVFIDGERFYSTDGFDSFKIDISALDRSKSHLLSVVVYPRAPEVLFGWHRQKDPYNGWFCGEITINGYGDVNFANLKAVTEQVNKDVATVKFSGHISKPSDVLISIEQIFGGNDTIKTVGEFSADGHFEFTASFNANIWDINKPNLYKVTFTAIENDKNVAKASIETGFRTIKQQNGEIHLNGRRIDLKGALLMQFLPPYNKTSETHICPTDEQVLWQEMMLKELGGNTLRLHVLGYGLNDARYARYADRLGILLIWTTRYIDTIEGVQWQGKWRAEKEFIKQITDRINHPSIIMWEGSNELRANAEQIDNACHKFVNAIKKVDTSRLICPISHLYYAGQLYPTRGCEYISNDGKTDHNGNALTTSSEWCDELVIRSAHTYSLLCGYGFGWDKLRLQPWDEQKTLLESNERAYIVSEYAVIGRQDPNTPEAINDYFNPYSYEFSDEKVLGFEITNSDWQISQAYQALCAHNCTKRMRIANVDGLLWCCLMGGANDGGYLKPIIDNYGYAKLGFYTMKSAFQDVCAYVDSVDIKIGDKLSFTPVIIGEKNKKYNLTVFIKNSKGNVIEKTSFNDIICSDRITKLPLYTSSINHEGYYGVSFEISENI